MRVGEPVSIFGRENERGKFESPLLLPENYTAVACHIQCFNGMTQQKMEQQLRTGSLIMQAARL